MSTQSVDVTSSILLLGDEAVALAASHAGVSAAYAYPGTPATEILESLIRLSNTDGRPVAKWCANEKTAFEEALGVSMAGKRALVTMKHVGLNVAADPFMNSAVVAPIGGIVLVVADDPGMHSSQNEQDSRYFADFARIPCLEPATPQQAYDMVREAYDVSERFRIPVMVRLVTRLAHQRAGVTPGTPRRENELNYERDRSEWTLLPNFARKLWDRRLEQSCQIAEWGESSKHNTLALNPSFRELGVITTGLASAYFLEAVRDLGMMPSHLHIGAYPMPTDKIRELARHVDEILILEEGYPFVERYVRGVLPQYLALSGKVNSAVPPAGELSSDIVRKTLGLEIAKGTVADIPEIPNRPPRLCDGCPHIDAYAALKKALDPFEHSLVTSDIGCYTLGALPPYEMGESCVCMGASVGMAKGAAEAGMYPVVGVIGDSTFLHSGITPLMDAVASNANMTLLILDNDVVAMTGSQPTLLPSRKLRDIVLGVGVDPEHFHLFEVHPRKVDELAELMRKEIDYKGLSVIIAHRVCLEAARRTKPAAKTPEVNP